ncbi:hypothetical protein MUK42_33645, partial [Musa troglodytarum]
RPGNSMTLPTSPPVLSTSTQLLSRSQQRMKRGMKLEQKETCLISETNLEHQKIPVQKRLLALSISQLSFLQLMNLIRL